MLSYKKIKHKSYLYISIIVNILIMRNLLLISVLILLFAEGFAQTCLRGDCKNGFGTMVFTSKSRYTGEFKQGKMHGKGIFYYSNQGKYIGEWQSGIRQGEGKWIQSNGNVYSGNFQQDKPVGQGTMNFKNGDRYTGNWTNELPNGKGTYYYAHGERYEGNFVNGKYQGQGLYFYKDGSVYNGEWKNGKREGKGELKKLDGKIINGEWAGDISLKEFEEEVGSQEDIEIAIEEAVKVPESSPKPEAKIENSDNNLPDCATSFCKEGRGKLLYADGSKYVGEFMNGEPKGKGICYYANGDKYEGHWQNHAPHGEGVMYFKSGLVYGAIWNNGKAETQLQKETVFKFDESIKSEKTTEVKIWAVIVGVAKYEHMPALKYADDDAYRIYAHLKSPEGGALKEDQIRVLIDEDATRNNILRAMNEVFMRADENDVVMLYFSGHGLEGTFIPIDYDGFSNAIKHEEIKEILSKSKAKHKVCYADACHSGSLLAAKGGYNSKLLYFYEEIDRTNGGTAFMMSSKGKEYSLEDGGLRQGIFSHYLIKGLRGEADKNSNKTITIRELFDYVSKGVKEYTVGAQTPLIAGDYDENMPVGFLRVD